MSFKTLKWSRTYYRNEQYEIRLSYIGVVIFAWLAVKQQNISHVLLPLMCYTLRTVCCSFRSLYLFQGRTKDICIVHILCTMSIRIFTIHFTQCSQTEGIF